MYCRYCGKSNEKTNRFCRHCGQELQSALPLCPACGKQLDENASFCRFCGQQLAQQAPQAPIRQAAAAPPPSAGWKKYLVVALTLLIAVCGLGLIAKFGMNNAYGSAVTRPPARAAIVNTQNWGLIPINEICMLLKDGGKKSDAEQIAKTLNGKIVGELDFIPGYLLEIPATSEQELSQALSQVRQHAQVAVATPNLPVEGSVIIYGTPCKPLDDPRYAGDQGANYRMIGLDNAWLLLQAAGVSLNDVNVGVVDNGVRNVRNEFGKTNKIEYTHTDAALSQALTYVDPKSQVAYEETSDSHGTAVARIIGASSVDGGLTGIASVLEKKMTITTTNWAAPPYNGSWAQVKTDPKDPAQKDFSNGTWAFSSLSAIHNTVKSGATIVNCSFGPAQAGTPNAAVAAIYRSYYERMAKEHPEVLFVCSAGNAGVIPGKDERWPGGMNLPNVITVGSIETNGQKSSYSNMAGPYHEVTLCAPGSDIVNGYNTANGSLSRESGTSFATPQVAAAAALLRSINPELKAADIKQLLTATANTQTEINGKTVAIPAAVSGRLLALDKAVLKAINDLRRKKDPNAAELTMEQALALGKMELVAEGGGKEWKLTTTVYNTAANGTEIEYFMQAPGSLGGSSKEKVRSNTPVSRLVTLFGDEGTVKVKRLDNRLCWQVRLTGEEFTELVKNPELKGAEAWQIQEWYKPAGGKGEVTAGTDGFRFYSTSGNNRIGVMQQLNADVSACSSLVLSATVIANTQTLSGTGHQGREAPVAVFVSYTDVTGVTHNGLPVYPGEAQNNRMYWHGFYYLDPVNDGSATYFGTKVGRSAAYTFETDLMTKLSPKPKFIHFIGAEGAGWPVRDGSIFRLSLKAK